MSKKKKQSEITWLIKVWIHEKMRMFYVDYHGDLVNRDDAVGFTSKDECWSFAVNVGERWKIPKKHMWLISIKETTHTLY